MKNMNFSQIPTPVDTNLVETEETSASQITHQSNDDIWIQTSMRMRKQTRNNLKLHAITHGMTMQEVIDIAVREYLNKK